MPFTFLYNNMEAPLLTTEVSRYTGVDIIDQP